MIDHKGAMWLATRSGLQRFNAKTRTFDYFGHGVRGAADKYYDIAEDDNGRLWLGGDDGLQQFDPSTGEFKVY